MLLRIKEIYNQSVFLENKINNIMDEIEPETISYDILIIEDDTSTIMVLTDFFEIKGINDISNELIIINSGGNEIYRQKNYQNDWDGTYKTGEELPDGTYYYIFYIYDTDKPREESGFVIIKR